MLRALILKCQLHSLKEGAIRHLPKFLIIKLKSWSTQFSTDTALLTPKGLQELHQILIYTIRSIFCNTA